MIFNELDKRIITSVILLPLIIFLIAWGPISHLILLTVVLIISLFEWIKMNSKLSLAIVIIGVVFLCFTMSFASPVVFYLPNTVNAQKTILGSRPKPHPLTRQL